MASYNYAKEKWVLEQLSSIPKFDIQVVDTLPIENISDKTVYLVRNTSVDNDNNLYTEYDMETQYLSPMYKETETEIVQTWEIKEIENEKSLIVEE